MTWFKVGNTSSLSNDGLVKANVNNLDVLVMKIKDRIYATSCYCTHEDYDLSEGLIDEGKLICPNHFATFEPKDGSVVSPPEGSGDISPLKSYPVKVENEEIFVDLQ